VIGCDEEDQIDAVYSRVYAMIEDGLVADLEVVMDSIDVDSVPISVCLSWLTATHPLRRSVDRSKFFNRVHARLSREVNQPQRDAMLRGLE